DGLIRLLASPVSVIVLRCDIAALGALAYGAVAAAVGTTTKLRHLYPPSDDNRPPRPPQLAAVVKPCLAYYTFDKTAQIVQTDLDNPWWRCDWSELPRRRIEPRRRFFVSGRVTILGYPQT